MLHLHLVPILAGVTLLLLSSPTAGQGSKYAQSAPPDAYEDGSHLAYYGSENEWSRRQFTAERAEAQPKRRGQRLLLAVLDGQPRQAVAWCQQRLAEAPNDLETLFVLTIAYCQLDELAKALATMRRAIDAGLPLERFLAGPRDLLLPLTRCESFRALVATRRLRLVHGPMLGAVTDRSARFWVRTASEASLTVRVFDVSTPGQPLREAQAATRADRDYTAIVEVADLQPNAAYEYDIQVGGNAVLEGHRPSFRTYPAVGTPARVRIGFGGGAGYTLPHERMWDTIAALSLDAFFFLGDNVYIDLPEQPGPVHRYTYYRRQSRPEFRRLIRSTPIYAIWDDHDCAVDDVWMGPYLDRPAWKRPQLALFQENWVNPGYGDAAWPGCWFPLSIGDVDFFLLDCRFYRTNPFAETRTMLGPTQKAWLLDGLRKSSATFKVLVSSVAWAPGAKPGSHDTWDGFPEEREEIFSAIESAHIEGVLLVSADRHRSDAWKIDRPAGYPLYDVMSSRLTNVHTHECLEQALFCYNEKCSFGLLTFDTTRSDPIVTYQIVNIDGEIVRTLALKRDQLRAIGASPGTAVPR